MDYSGVGSGQGVLQETRGAEEVAGTNTHKFLWTIFFGVIFIVIFIVVYLIFTSGHKNVSDKKLIEGIAMEVGENDVITFDLEKEEHGMWINFLGDGSVELTISSNPINLSLKINEIKEIDLDNNGIFDLKIKLVSIINRKATIAIQKIGEESCQANWKCSEWLNCSKGIQKRECDDLNSCDAIFDKPSEIKNCLEIEFIENDSSFYEGEEEDGINFLDLNFSYDSEDNITDKDNTTDEDNRIDENNTTNTIDLTSCPQNTSFCQEDSGFFCEIYPDSSILNSYCCPKECLKFNSEEQLCSARGYFYFESNETHICNVRVYSSFNGKNILCCASVKNKVNIGSTISSP
jgi:hypothetical protein